MPCGRNFETGVGVFWMNRDCRTVGEIGAAGGVKKRERIGMGPPGDDYGANSAASTLIPPNAMFPIRPPDREHGVRRVARVHPAAPARKPITPPTIATMLAIWTVVSDSLNQPTPISAMVAVPTPDQIA